MMKSYSTAGRHPSDKGFTLLELLIVLSILTLFSVSSAVPANVFLYLTTQDRIIHTQTKVLFRRRGEMMKLDALIEHYAEVRFNEKGNVLNAQTLRFDGNRKIVILLGPGRIHE
jgi:prepilin-type N-terminal cleavage/methylation domain-containing protein